MPLGQSFNVTGTANEQPEYQVLWEPMAINPASTITATTYPSVFTAGVGWVAGAALQYGLSGTTITPAGTNWPAGSSTSPPAISGTVAGDDYGGLSAPYTIQTVDIAAVSTTTLFAGVLLGVGTLGANSPVAPNTITGRLPSQVAMVGKRGICQVLMDAASTPTAGDTFKVSTTSAHTGLFSDVGSSTYTAGTTCGVVLQTISSPSAPTLVWVKLNAY